MAGTIKTDVIQSELTTPTVFRNTSGTEIGRMCLGWMNFGYVSSAVTTRGSFNLSSITRNGTGDYTLSYTNAYSSGNYSWIVGGAGDATSEGAWNTISNSPTASSGRVRCFSSSGTAQDQTAIHVSIFI
jgi:hypothetical protein